MKVDVFALDSARMYMEFNKIRNVDVQLLRLRRKVESLIYADACFNYLETRRVW